MKGSRASQKDRTGLTNRFHRSFTESVVLDMWNPFSNFALFCLRIPPIEGLLVNLRFFMCHTYWLEIEQLSVLYRDKCVFWFPRLLAENWPDYWSTFTQVLCFTGKQICPDLFWFTKVCWITFQLGVGIFEKVLTVTRKVRPGFGSTHWSFFLSNLDYMIFGSKMWVRNIIE